MQILWKEAIDMKVMTILGTRPEIIRLSEVIKAADQAFDHILVHTGQNYDYELNEIFFEELGLRKPDYFLNCVGQTLGDTMGNVIGEAYKLIQKVKPDAILVLGDTNSALSAISAKRLKTPIFHMEAGNRCGDWNVPEMTNRVIVDHISDMNLPYSGVAENNLLNEGLPKQRIIRTGSPMKEVLLAHKKEIDGVDVLSKLGLKKGKYLVMSSHREENVDIPSKFRTLFSSLNEIADTMKMPVIFSCHPRTRKRLEKEGYKLSQYIRECKPFGFFEYLALQKDAYCVLSDSGTLSEESSLLDFPAVLIRTSTERQEANRHGSIFLGGITKQSILEAMEKARAVHPGMTSIVPDYDVDNVSSLVVETIKKYTDIINEETWVKK
jgi:UDP-N-acetylglucosamine 2-epimerase